MNDGETVGVGVPPPPPPPDAGEVVAVGVAAGLDGCSVGVAPDGWAEEPEDPVVGVSPVPEPEEPGDGELVVPPGLELVGWEVDVPAP